MEITQNLSEFLNEEEIKTIALCVVNADATDNLGDCYKMLLDGVGERIGISGRSFSGKISALVRKVESSGCPFIQHYFIKADKASKTHAVHQVNIMYSVLGESFKDNNGGMDAYYEIERWAKNYVK